MLSKLIQNIAVIGANGFIGKHFVDEVRNQNKTKLILWNRSKHGSFLNAEDREAFLVNYQIEIIFNFAWSPIGRDTYENDYANFDFAEATLAFTRQCRLRSVPVVVMGSLVADKQGTSTPYSFAKRFLQEVYRAEQPNNVCLIKPTYLFSLKYLRPRILRNFFEFEKLNSLHNFQINKPQEFLRALHVQDFASGLLNLDHSFKSYVEIEISSGFQIKLVDFISLVAYYSNPTSINQPRVSLITESEIPPNTIISQKVSRAFFMGNQIEEIKNIL